MQDRKTYAKGVTNVTADAKAKISMPVVDGEDTVAAEATAASFVGEIPESGSMLVTLEVNGTVIAYREMYTIDPDEGYIQVGVYTIANSDGGVVTVEAFEANDVVRLKVEPIEIELNDVFRAAVGEVAQKSGGGSGGGGVLAVHDEDGTLDKTWREIIDAVASTGAVVVWENDGTVVSAHIITLCEINIITQKFIVAVAGTDSYYEADTESDYPVLQQ